MQSKLVDAKPIDEWRNLRKCIYGGQSAHICKRHVNNRPSRGASLWKTYGTFENLLNAYMRTKIFGCNGEKVVSSIVITNWSYNTLPCETIVLHSQYFCSLEYGGIGYIANACWTPFFFGSPILCIFQTWCPRLLYFSQNSLNPIYGRNFFAKSAQRRSLWSCSQGTIFHKTRSSILVGWPNKNFILIFMYFILFHHM